MSLRKYLTIYVIVTAMIWSSALAFSPPPMTENLEWKGRIVVEVSDKIAPLEISHQMGLALTQNSELDLQAARYNVFNITKLIPWAEKIMAVFMPIIFASASLP